MQEIWKDIEGYEGRYQVSNFGNVKSLYYINGGNEKILKPLKCTNGYLSIHLHKEGKRKCYLLHRLVAKAFIANPYNLQQVNHKDENITNNIADNLEWCSPKYNANFGSRNKRVGEKLSKKICCIETNRIFNSITQAAKELGLKKGNISAVCRGIQKTCGGFHWRYTE